MSFFRQTDGQDIIEYTLLLSFVVIVSAALFQLSGTSISAIWGVTNNHLSTAQSIAGS